MQPTPWMDWLRKHIGEMEKTGEIPTPFDQEVFNHTSLGHLTVMLAGCAATLCAALEESGYASPHSAAAISFAHYGTPCELTPGAILVYKWSSGEHHVTTCDEIIDEHLVKCLGGNQSHMVKDSVYERKYIVAIRWPVISH